MLGIENFNIFFDDYYLGTLCCYLLIFMALWVYFVLICYIFPILV
jgi:hypothetical protein